MNAVELIPNLLKAGIDSDKKMLEAAALMIAKKIKDDYPDVAETISHILTNASFSTPPSRSLSTQPRPVDRETRYALVDVEEPHALPAPILEEYTQQQLQDFIKERGMLPEFLAAGITPPNSLLLHGQPGVGKTYIAHWISSQLNIPLITLDLATAISSYLGRSGQNIRNVFDFAKNQPSVLLLDELDAIAKRRDDSGDLGELKRLVNVLLKEIEVYPTTGILIGATNHPKLLDKAIWRRFDRAIEIPMPDTSERQKLLERHLGEYGLQIGAATICYVAKVTAGINSADICKLCEHIKRGLILSAGVPPQLIALSELSKIASLDKSERIKLCRSIKSEFPAITQRAIAQITRIPLSSVSRYLADKREDAQDE